MAKIEFPPNINDFLAEEKNNAKPNTGGLQEMVAFVQARTGLSNAICKIAISRFFTELQNAFLEEKIIYLDDLGSFYRDKSNTLTLKVSKKLKNKINAKYK